MKKRSVLSILIAFVMFSTIFLMNAPEAEAASQKSTYWLKVNTKANVITAYKYDKEDKKYVPYRAMVCSTGTSVDPTPLGNFKLGAKIRWCNMMGDVWGQYCSVIRGNYLFHSVWYYEPQKNMISSTEYNKLGTNCSHGCVRLSTMDAKWIYDNCKRGTKITIYRSSKPGPLGKPKPIKMKSSWGWDPTDPDKRNPNFKMKKPVIEISKKKADTIEYGKSYKLKSKVTAKNPHANQSLTNKIKVHSVKIYDKTKKKYVKAKFSTKKVGTYKIQYKVSDKYCGGTTYKTFKVKVVDTKAPTITAANRTVTLGSADAKNAVQGVTAKQKSCDRTSAIKVKIRAPGESKYKEYSYKKASKYVFDKEGVYKIKYTVKNRYSPYKKKTKTITVTCVAPAPVTPEVTPETQAVTIEGSSAVAE